jgi:hypothetical protein
MNTDYILCMIRCVVHGGEDGKGNLKPSRKSCFPLELVES